MIRPDETSVVLWLVNARQMTPDQAINYYAHFPESARYEHARALMESEQRKVVPNAQNLK